MRLGCTRTAQTGFACLATLLVLWFAASASASKVELVPDPELGGDVMLYAASPGEVNNTYRLGTSNGLAGVQELSSSPITISPVPPCQLDSGSSSIARCPATGVVEYLAELGDLDDVGSAAMTGGLPTPVIDGGEGNDTLYGSSDFAVLIGGPGADKLVGSVGDEVLDGGPGPDELRGNSSFDLPGDVDTADYGERTAAVVVTLDGQANDGEPGEGDFVASDVEDIDGGAGDDQIAGNEHENYLRGFEGADRLDGGAGADIAEGGDGDDTIVARDGVVDTVRCGAGTDRVIADAVDAVSECETVELPQAPVHSPAAAPPPAAAPAPQPDRLAPTVRVGSARRVRLATALRRGLVVPVSCSEACGIRVDLRGLGRTLARGTARLSRSGRVLAPVRFTTTAERELRRTRRLKATLRVTAKDAAGNAKTVSKALVLRR
jgi:Ca2+-binding RTX toxin-like protein